MIRFSDKITNRKTQCVLGLGYNNNVGPFPPKKTLYPFNNRGVQFGLRYMFCLHLFIVIYTVCMYVCMYVIHTKKCQLKCELIFELCSPGCSSHSPSAGARPAHSPG